MIYRLDLHCHTERSPDSRMALDTIVRTAKQRGIHAVAISDHYRCSAPEVFEKPLRDGVLLIPSVEYSTECGHLLGLFLREPTNTPGDRRIAFSEAAAAIHRAGGLCILAHPFELTHHSTDEITAQAVAHADELDGIESFNCRATKKRKNANALAADLLPDKLRTAGSDAHIPSELGRASVTVEAESLTCDALREALAHPLDFTCGRCRHMAIARSQWIRLRKRKRGLIAHLRWFPFAGLCLLRTVIPILFPMVHRKK